MIKIPPCDLPMGPLVPMVPLAAENVQGFLVTIGKNGTNSTIGSFTDFTIGKTPNVARFSAANGTIGTNGTIGRSHGGIFIILINTPHLFLFVLFTPCILCYL